MANPSVDFKKAFTSIGWQFYLHEHKNKRDTDSQVYRNGTELYRSVQKCVMGQFSEHSTFQNLK